MNKIGSRLTSGNGLEFNVLQPHFSPDLLPLPKLIGEVFALWIAPHSWPRSLRKVSP